MKNKVKLKAQKCRYYNIKELVGMLEPVKREVKLIINTNSVLILKINAKNRYSKGRYIVKQFDIITLIWL